MNLPKINLIILFVFISFNAISLAIQPCREFFLISNQDYYTDQQNEYAINKKLHTNKNGQPYSSEALFIELYKKNRLTARFLVSPLAWNFTRACGLNLKLGFRKNSIEVIDKNTHNTLNILSIPDHLCNDYCPVFELVLSQNEQYAAAVTTKNVAFYWDLQKQQEIFMMEKATCVALSPDGTLFATGDEHGIITIFDNKTKKHLRITLPNVFYTKIISLEFSYDGTCLIAVSMPAFKYHKHVVPQNDHEIWDDMFEMRSDDLPVPDCYHHMTLFEIAELL